MDPGIVCEVFPVADPILTVEDQVNVDPGTELLNWMLEVLAVQIGVAVFEIVIAGLGFAVTVNVKGVPVHVLLEGVNA
jgi:hypothetical protein